MKNKPEKSLTVLLGLGKPKKEPFDPEMMEDDYEGEEDLDEYDEEEDYEEDNEMLEMAASEIISALESKDSASLVEALKLFINQCK